MKDMTHYVLDLLPNDPRSTSDRWPRTPCGLSARFQVLQHAETPTCPQCAAWLLDRARHERKGTYILDSLD